MRVIVTGMGGELGMQVATRLVARPEVAEVAGMDVHRPQRRLRGAAFHEVDPRDRHRVLPIVREFEPTAIVHLGIYESDARAEPRLARERTVANTVAVLGAAAELGSLDRMVVRSGLEVYGRGRGSVMAPDEGVAPLPTSDFGRTLLEVERLATATGRAADVPVTALRFAPLVGPRFPSPLGRFLRLPVVPFSGLADPPFSVAHVEDAADAVVAALLDPHDEPLNVVATGAVTVSQAARLGRRLPVPAFGPQWVALRQLAGLVRVPLPDHLVELVRRGRTADGARAGEVLRIERTSTTIDIVRSLYNWRDRPALSVVRGEAA